MTGVLDRVRRWFNWPVTFEDNGVMRTMKVTEATALLGRINRAVDLANDEYAEADMKENGDG